MIRALSSRIANELASDALDQNLRSVIKDAHDYLYRIWTQDLILSCLLRTPEEDKALYHDPNHEPGVHCFGRGADVSVRFMSSAEVSGLCNTINSSWQYDPSRPNMVVALYESAGHQDSTAPHIHLQTHPATSRIVKIAADAVQA